MVACVVTTCKYRNEAKVRRDRQKRKTLGGVGLATMLGGTGGQTGMSSSIGGLAAGFTLSKPQCCESTSLTAENLASVDAMAPEAGSPSVDAIRQSV